MISNNNKLAIILEKKKKEITLFSNIEPSPTYPSYLGYDDLSDEDAYYMCNFGYIPSRMH